MAVPDEQPQAPLDSPPDLQADAEDDAAQLPDVDVPLSNEDRLDTLEQQVQAILAELRMNE